ncbi:MAG: hypothetical protein M3Z23_04055 [Acidobacteriota bacterium]|nr:hypothetical protein [Acidobacteriota bacterium]
MNRGKVFTLRFADPRMLQGWHFRPGRPENQRRTAKVGLEQKLQSDFRQTHSRTVDLFAQTIDSKVGQRISALEQNLPEHSNTIVSLREKSLSTDENLQTILAAVEKLCAETAARVDAKDAKVDTQMENSIKPPDAPAGQKFRGSSRACHSSGRACPAANDDRLDRDLLIQLFGNKIRRLKPKQIKSCEAWALHRRGPFSRSR